MIGGETLYLIDKKANRITKVEEKTFTELGFKERENLQEWLANNPEALGEELLLIQKEFDGFSDTRERLDLLALDKQGNLVIIENKLDDTGRDVTWQVLKYASYCSTLSKSQVKDLYQQYLDKLRLNEKAEDKLEEFFDGIDYEELAINSGQTQRIIMVAGSFRKEVTSTVLWLMNYKLRIQCFKVTPYAMEDKLFLDIEQIIPMKEAENFIISMADKTQQDINTQEETKSRYLLRLEFWREILNLINEKSTLFQNISPSKDHWLAAGSGVSGVGFHFVIAHYYARAEVYISKGNVIENKFIFDELFKQREQIEHDFGHKLKWERLDNKKSCRIKYELENVSVFNKEDWPKMIDFMIDGMIRIEKAFKEPLKKAGMMLKNKPLG